MKRGMVAKRAAKNKSGSAEALPACVCGALRIVTRAVTQLYDDMIRPAGLRITQYSILVRIERMGRVSAADLVDALHADQTTLARALKLLRAEQLIRTVPHPDRRIKLVELTQAGSRRLALARKLWSEGQRRIVAQIGEKEWGEIRVRLNGLLMAVAPSERAQKESRAA